MVFLPGLTVFLFAANFFALSSSSQMSSLCRRRYWRRNHLPTLKI